MKYIILPILFFVGFVSVSHAVIIDAGDHYVLGSNCAASANPGDGTTAYDGLLCSSGSATQSAFIVPYDSTINLVAYAIRVSGTLGSAETGTTTLMVNGAQSLVLDSAQLWNMSFDQYSTTTAISVMEGDTVSIRTQYPTWVTNPTTVTRGYEIGLYASSTINVDVSSDSATSTVNYVYNSNQDLWNGMILFFLVLFFIIWMFRRT